jgi:hypothetical protein
VLNAGALAVLCSAAMLYDASARRWRWRRWAGPPLAAIPVFGPALYLALRPCAYARGGAKATAARGGGAAGGSRASGSPARTTRAAAAAAAPASPEHAKEVKLRHLKKQLEY